MKKRTTQVEHKIKLRRKEQHKLNIKLKLEEKTTQGEHKIKLRRKEQHKWNIRLNLEEKNNTSGT